MKHGKIRIPLGLMLMLLVLLLSGCASDSVNLLRPVTPPTIPPLPAQAKQPAIPSMCLPTCSAALTKERESWLNTLTPPASPGRPANAPMTH